MADLLPTLSKKYRIFLITQVDSEGGSDHLKAQKLLQSLINCEAVQEHRSMFCTTSKGKESLVRQLSADLHIDCDANLCSNLVRFLSKFHLLSEEESASETA